jgi:1-phosphofructokinase family hexose kinase
LADIPRAAEIICVALSPAIDRTLEVRGLELGQHTQGRFVARQAAGKAVNVARVLQTLGTSCTLTGFVGEVDRPMFEESFDASVVRVQLFGLPGPTRESITLVDRQKGIETHIRDEGSQVAVEDLDRLVKKLTILAKPEAPVVFAGSLPQGLSVSQFRDILAVVVGQGARVVLDSSEGALGVVAELPVWFIKPNLAELASVTGRATESPEEIIAAIRQLPDSVEIALVSAGPDGCYMARGGKLLHARVGPLPKPVANTVGCGDALLAGLLAGWAEGLDDEAALRRAVATATSACFHLQAGQVDVDEIASLAGRVEIRTVAG